MHSEKEPNRIELKELALSLVKTFIQRRDLFARQLDDGRYVCVREPLTDNHLVDHLRGNITLGTYVLDRDSQARFVAIDADDDESMEEMTNMGAWLAEEDVPTYLEKSRRGGHLWLFFASELPGIDARTFGAGLLAYRGLQGIELFPKQDKLSSGPGSLIRLPFGIHRKTGRRYGFYLPTGQPLAPTLREQIRILASPRSVPESFIKWFQDYSIEDEADLYREADSIETAALPVNNSEMPLSGRIKTAITVRDFVERLVDLSDEGTGICPFHDDNVASFSVNESDNYWHCFACGTGGSIIDFWMAYQQSDFKTAVKELAQMLL